MATYDKGIWRPIVARLLSLHRETTPWQFLADHAMTNSVRLDLVEHKDEDRRKVLTVEAMYRLCDKADISPTWLMFGKGEKNLSDIVDMEARTENIQAKLASMSSRLPLSGLQEVENLLRELFDGGTATKDQAPRDLPRKEYTGDPEQTEPRKTSASPKRN